jgi:dihydropteroate synthase
MNSINSRGLTNNLDSTCNQWSLRSRVLKFGRLPALMGIVNVTPDSFSDGGHHNQVEAAVEHALQLADQGASILDIGGESTRPYSQAVAVEEELSRVVPVIRQLAQQTKVPISIDTSKATVARAALDAGAEIINDVTGLTGDPAMVDLAVRSGAGICAMHMQGTPQDMQDNPHYDDVEAEIFAYLKGRDEALLEAGIAPEKICLDPGIGFGKTHTHNLQLVAAANKFHQLGRVILVGHSRKGFIGKAIGDKLASRTFGTLAVTLQLAQQAIQVIRVHEIEPAMQALAVLDATGGIDGQIQPLD